MATKQAEAAADQLRQAFQDNLARVQSGDVPEQEFGSYNRRAALQSMIDEAIAGGISPEMLGVAGGLSLDQQQFNQALSITAKEFMDSDPNFTFDELQYALDALPERHSIQNLAGQVRVDPATGAYLPPMGVSREEGQKAIEFAKENPWVISNAQDTGMTQAEITEQLQSTINALRGQTTQTPPPPTPSLNIEPQFNQGSPSAPASDPFMATAPLASDPFVSGATDDYLIAARNIIRKGAAAEGVTETQLAQQLRDRGIDPAPHVRQYEEYMATQAPAESGGQTVAPPAEPVPPTEAAPSTGGYISERHPYAAAEETSAISYALKAAYAAAALGGDPMDYLGFIELNQAVQDNPFWMEVFENALTMTEGSSASEIRAMQQDLGRGELSWLDDFRAQYPLSQEAQASLANLYDQSINWRPEQMPAPRPPQDPDVPSAGGIGGQPGQPGYPVPPQPTPTPTPTPTPAPTPTPTPQPPIGQPPIGQPPTPTAPPQQDGLMTNQPFWPYFNNAQYGPNPSDAMFNPYSRANNFYTQQLRRQQQQRADMREANSGRDWSTGHLADPFQPSGGGNTGGIIANPQQPPATQPPPTTQQPPATQPPVGPSTPSTPDMNPGFNDGSGYDGTTSGSSGPGGNTGEVGGVPPQLQSVGVSDPFMPAPQLTPAQIAALQTNMPTIGSY